MMPPILTKDLPAEQRQRVHADFLANEQHYLRMRDGLLPQYRGQWVAVHDGRVIAAGSDLLSVIDAAAAVAKHPYIACVGEEDAVVFRVRTATFSYDATYRPVALPRVTVTFGNHTRTHARVCADVIPDTGADLSVLPDADCQAIDLYNSPCFTGLAGGVVGAGVATFIYRGIAEIDGQCLPALIQALPNTRERIVGREVLNQLRVLFDGPAGVVTINP